MPRSRHRRRIEKQLRHAQRQPRVIVREAEGVDRLCYTRAEAAEALGVSQSTLKRLLPYIAQVELPWGTKLIPRDELERLAAERRRAPRKPRRSSRPSGRPAVLPAELVERIRAEHAGGQSLAQIARELNASGTPTAHGGRQWWPSTVRAVLTSSSPRSPDFAVHRPPGESGSAQVRPAL
jgi:DNA invertase Pin-like site-specific DNA recombinase